MQLLNNKLNERKIQRAHRYMEQTKFNCGADIQSTNIEALSDETFDKITFIQTAIYRVIQGGKKNQSCLFTVISKN